MRVLKFLSFLLILALPAQAAKYKVDYSKSQVGFAGKHTGKDFLGVFEDWNASIVFDENDLAASQITATFNLESANTGNKMYDGTLPQADWFNVKEHPEGVFKSTAITQNQDGSYHIEGDLTLRGITKPQMFDFTLQEIDGGFVTAEAHFTINRLDYDIGRGSDEKGDWVSLEIAVEMDITATPQDP